MKTIVEFRHFATNEPLRYWDYNELDVIPRAGEQIKLDIVNPKDDAKLTASVAYKVWGIKHVITNTGMGKVHTVIIHLNPYDHWFD